MESVPFLLIILCSANSIVFDDRFKNPKIETEARLFDVNKSKLQQYWQYASTMALIKAHTRKKLLSLPRIEKIVFEQCSADARTVIDIAKCSRRVINAEQYQKSIELQALQNEKLSLSKDIKAKLLKIQKIQVLPSSRLIEVNDSSGLYYSQSRRKWVRNPIRSQMRKRAKRNDQLMEAFDLFLEEERRKKKLEDEKKKIKVLEKVAETNVFGIPRRIQMHRRKRRSIEEIIRPTKASTNINMRNLVSKYFLQLIDGNDSSFIHLNNIRRLRHHFLRVEKCNGYFKLMNDENKKLFNEMKLGINSADPVIENQHSSIDQILEIINSFSASEMMNQKFSFLSPRILSIMPESARKNRLLSPTLLSFHRDGFFSLPDLFEIVSSNQRYQQVMLEAILDLSGAGNALEEVLVKMSPEMNFMEEVQYPLIQKMSRDDIKWLKTRQTFSEKQWDDYNRNGLAYLTEEQLNLLHGDESPFSRIIANLTNDEREARIDEDIQKLASEGSPKWPFWNNNSNQRKQGRWKRDAAHEDHSLNIPNYPHGELINGVEYMTLKPFAFANLINFGISMESMILSPHAFVSEIMRPEALKLDLLSPRAFIATVLSPSALLARILSPTALRAEVLSPRALTAWVLSPEALIAEVLSPRFLEPRVLSPEALVIDVLSPGILAPHVASSEVIGVMILSPNILSPRIASDEKFIVEILSPHILGGPHSEEEEHTDVLQIGSKSSHIHDESIHPTHHQQPNHGEVISENLIS